MITQPVQNMRFTQSYPLALAPGAVLGVGAGAVWLPSAGARGLPGARTAPGLLELHRQRLRLSGVGPNGGCLDRARLVSCFLVGQGEAVMGSTQRARGRRVAFAAVALVIVGLVGGCGGPEPPSSATEPNPPDSQQYKYQLSVLAERKSLFDAYVVVASRVRMNVDGQKLFTVTICGPEAACAQSVPTPPGASGSPGAGRRARRC